MSLNTILHVTIRLDAPGHPHTQIDLAVPAQSSISDILDEVLSLAKAPAINRPWQPTTAAGTMLSVTTPLAALPLAHGNIIVLRPYQETPPPLVKDAAEALIDAPQPDRAKHLHVATILTGIIGVTWWGFMLPEKSWLALAAISLASIILLAIATHLHTTSEATRLALAFTTPVPAGLSAWTYVTHGELTRGSVLAGGISTLITIAIACIAVQIISYCPAIISTIWAMIGTMASCALGTLALVPTQLQVIAPSVATTALALLALLSAPSLAVQLAGLRAPKLPSAGQSFSVSDHTMAPEDTQSAAQRAIELHNGMVIGLSISGAIGITLLCAYHTADSAPYCAALCAAMAAAIVLHAIRHRSPYATWALWCWALLCLLSSVQTIPVVGFLLVALCLSSIVWAHRIPDLQPTTICWLERLEAFAIAVVLPLAAHIAGLFMAIRGLG